jgi:hypothetical protein
VQRTGPAPFTAVLEIHQQARYGAALLIMCIFFTRHTFIFIPWAFKQLEPSHVVVVGSSTEHASKQDSRVTQPHHAKLFMLRASCCVAAHVHLCRWRLHPDAKASADALLSAPLGSRQGSRQQGQQLQQQVCLHTQWRSWDKHVRMMVQFESIDAGREAVDAAEGLAVLAATASPAIAS